MVGASDDYERHARFLPATDATPIADAMQEVEATADVGREDELVQLDARIQAATCSSSRTTSR
jgi:hypothetical protein